MSDKTEVDLNNRLTTEIMLLQEHFEKIRTALADELKIYEANTKRNYGHDGIAEIKSKEFYRGFKEAVSIVKQLMPK